MVKPVFSVLPATAAGSGRDDLSAGACRPGVRARSQRQAGAPPRRIGAEPETGEAGVDYTAFSMVGIAG